MQRDVVIEQEIVGKQDRNDNSSLHIFFTIHVLHAKTDGVGLYAIVHILFLYIFPLLSLHFVYIFPLVYVISSK